MNFLWKIYRENTVFSLGSAIWDLFRLNRTEIVGSSLRGCIPSKDYKEWIAFNLKDKESPVVWFVVGFCLFVCSPKSENLNALVSHS